MFTTPGQHAPIHADPDPLPVGSDMISAVALYDPDHPREWMFKLAVKALEEAKDDRANTPSLLALTHGADELTGLVRNLVEGLDSIERQLTQVTEALGRLGGPPDP
jgi:hypothetical protein